MSYKHKHGFRKQSRDCVVQEDTKPVLFYEPQKSKQSFSEFERLSRQPRQEKPFPSCLKDDKMLHFVHIAPSVGEGGLYSEHILSGVEAKFASINSRGGVNGKFLKVEKRDDWNNPQRFYKQTKKSIKNGFTVFLGSVGTQNVLNVMPLIKEKKVLQLFPFAFHPKLQSRYLPCVINGCNNSRVELEKLVHYAYHKLRANKIALFYPNDTFGEEFAYEFKNILERFNLDPIAVASYNPENPAIRRAAKELAEVDPEVVISLGNYIPTRTLIRSFAWHNRYNTKFLGLGVSSFAGQIMKDRGNNFYYSTCMPTVQETRFDIVRQFLEDMKKRFPSDWENRLSHISLEYYLNATVIALALENCDGNINQASLQNILIDKIGSIKDIDLGGLIVDFCYETRQVYPLDPQVVASRRVSPKCFDKSVMQ